MEQARANQAQRLARLQAQQPEPEPEVVRQPTMSDMPSEVMRSILISAASRPRPTQYWHVPMLRDLARLAPTSRGIDHHFLGSGNSAVSTGKESRVAYSRRTGRPIVVSSRCTAAVRRRTRIGAASVEKPMQHGNQTLLGTCKDRGGQIMVPRVRMEDRSVD